MTTLSQTLADIQAEIERQKASGNVSPLVAGIIAHEALLASDGFAGFHIDDEAQLHTFGRADMIICDDVDPAIDLEPTEWDLVDDEAQLRALPGYYDGF
ncbi:MAG: hypothetical protein DI533_21400 [Cereibacter sphaeroides]|uniref:Uncharacterized protein n=1 Tax=Cereibacter sphaeroides TaxID=1063 RepID=A0A2W5S706_CERSP|nr:MAG: hypothetical protein DI533_21400 [Cereibacter sphaeroides]